MTWCEKFSWTWNLFAKISKMKCLRKAFLQCFRMYKKPHGIWVIFRYFTSDVSLCMDRYFYKRCILAPGVTLSYCHHVLGSCFINSFSTIGPSPTNTSYCIVTYSYIHWPYIPTDLTPANQRSCVCRSSESENVCVQIPTAYCHTLQAQLVQCKIISSWLHPFGLKTICQHDTWASW